MIGLAIGDALGFPTEPLSLEAIRADYGPTGITDFVSARGLPPGSYSDDTQLTLATARALLAAGGQSTDELMDAFCEEFLDWYRSPDVARGPGMTTLGALANLAQGDPWNESGIRSSKGCGGAMRVAPIGLYFYREREKLRHLAQLNCLITHGHPTGVAAAVLNALAVARAVEKASPQKLLAELLSNAERLDADLAAALAKVKQCEGMEPPEAFAHIGETGSAEEVLASALFCFLRSPRDYRATVLAAANSSGDSDSIAAMAGALSGAYNGLEAIPENWRQAVENRDEIERLARALFTRAGPA
ncbi:MAG: ADP-ribosylglycohydrolase family protein [Terriglobia bacterium]